MTAETVRGVIEAVSKENDLGAPAGHVWVRLASSSITYLANVSLAIHGLRQGNNVEFKIANSKHGLVIESVTLLEKGLEASEAESSTPENVPNKLLSSPPGPDQSRYSEDFVERFWAKVDKSGKCWLWIGATTGNGYGAIQAPHHGGSLVAHRVAYELQVGPIPSGMWVLHHCDNPLCVTADHLFLGTPLDNVTDMDAKGRRPTQLDRNLIEEIRKIHAAGGITQQQLADQYEVSFQHISEIINEKHWNQAASNSPTTPPKLRKSEGNFVTVPLVQIQESSWNPNEMNEETFHDLLQDLRVGGQYVVNPIDLFAITHDEAGVIRYQIADGHNRYRAARKAGWKEIRAIVYDMDEDQAKVWNYRKNRERGTINPTKEAKLFQGEAERGRTQQEIAAKYGVSQPYVSERLRNLPIYSTGIKPSHAEEISHTIKDPEVRQTVARVAVKKHLTPEETGEVAKRVKKDLEDKPKATKKFVRVKAEQHAREVKSPSFQPEPDHEFHCPRCRTNQVVFCGGPRNHRVVPVAEERRDRD